MTGATQTTRTRPFRLELEGSPTRVVRGRFEYLPEAEDEGTPHPFVLVLHGFKGFMDWGFFPELSRRIARSGMVAVSFNFSGSGVGDDLESFTEEEAFFHNTYTQELEDADLVRQFLEESRPPFLDLSRAALFGHSMGGGVALLHAAERGDYRALTTWAAISRVARYDGPTVRRWERQGFLPIVNARTGQTLRLGTAMLDDVRQEAERLDIPAAVARLSCPTLMFHGREDEAVPVEEGELLGQALPAELGRLECVPGAGHTFGAVHPLAEIEPPLERVLVDTVDHFHRHLLG